jgi:hypothetical protein
LQIVYTKNKLSKLTPKTAFGQVFNKNLSFPDIFTVYMAQKAAKTDEKTLLVLGC